MSTEKYICKNIKLSMTCNQHQQ